VGNATGLCRVSCRPAYIRRSPQAHRIITAAGRIIAVAGVRVRNPTTNNFGLSSAAEKAAQRLRQPVQSCAQSPCARKLATFIEKDVSRLAAVHCSGSSKLAQRIMASPSPRGDQQSLPSDREGVDAVVSVLSESVPARGKALAPSNRTTSRR
jgi:hypothetical protein